MCKNRQEREQEGYVEAFHGKGTFCSENMRHTKKSGNIAVVTTYISDYIFPRLIQGMDNVLSEKGYSIISEKYEKQPAEGSQMSGRASSEGYRRSHYRAEQSRCHVVM